MKNMKYVLLGLVVLFVFAMSAPFSNYYGMQTVRLYNEIFLYNTSGTQKFAIDNNGSITVSSTVAVIDSFTTTAASDTVTMTGASLGDVLQVTQFTPNYSTDPDTNVTYSAYVLSTNTVVVVRTKNAATNDLKSGGQFYLVKLHK